MKKIEFTDFRNEIKKRFDDLADNFQLFYVDVDKDELWNYYLDSFPAGSNPIYKTKREYDCSCCRHFIKKIAPVVAINNNEVLTIWQVTTGDFVFDTVSSAMDSFVRKHKIKDVFLDSNRVEGDRTTYSENGVFNHYYVEIPARHYWDKRTVNEKVGEKRDSKNVFKRSLEEVTKDAVETVLELISSNSLYRGKEWESSIKKFYDYKKAYDDLTNEEEKDLFAWEKSLEAGITVARIKNHSIGKLLTDISNGEDLERSVRSYEEIVAPANYKRPKAIFTKKMLEDAKNELERLGYLKSIYRRFATLDDISINNVLFANRDAQTRIKPEDIFSEMEKNISVDPKKFSRVEQVTINDFIQDVIPNVNELEVLLENRHKNNFVSLIAPKYPESKPMFKWNNGFCWAYTGNMADSEIKRNVKNAGGKVDGDLRFSIQWNDVEQDICDLDAHCYIPDGGEIYFGNKKNSNTLGELDVDIISPVRGVSAVENITWPDKNRLIRGTYRMFVHRYSGKNSHGFRAEIEFDGKIHYFNYQNAVTRYVNVADIIVDKNKNISIVEHLNSSGSSSYGENWGVQIGQFVPVSVMMMSPNYWDNQTGIGNKHYFFMLKDCVNPENPNGFYNEYFKNDLMKHKRVLEALGAKAAVESVEDQLSGVGFSSTKRDSLIVKVKGKTERVMKVIF